MKPQIARCCLLLLAYTIRVGLVLAAWHCKGQVKPIVESKGSDSHSDSEPNGGGPSTSWEGPGPPHGPIQIGGTTPPPTPGDVSTSKPHLHWKDDGKDVPCREKQPRSKNKGNWSNEWYYCDPQDRVTTVLGIYLHGLHPNTGDEHEQPMENITKPLPEAKYGVEVLKKHPLDYDNLRANLSWEKEWSVEWEYVPTPMVKEVRTISVLGGKITFVYQTTSSCGYVNGGQMEVEVVKVYSAPSIENRLYFITSDCNAKVGNIHGISLDKEGHSLDTYVRNHGDKPRSACFTYWEGSQTSRGPEHYVQPYEGTGDDSAELLAGVFGNVTQLANPSPTSGIEWPTSFFTRKEYGKRRRNYTVIVPPGKEARIYQLYAMCYGFRVLGPIFPVYVPDTHPEGYVGACESPFTVPFCMAGGGDTNIGTPEMALNWGKTWALPSGCAEDLRKIEVVPDPEPHVELKLGVKGPYADQLGNDFKAKFLSKLPNMRVDQKFHQYTNYWSTGYNWTNFKITNWHEYENTKRSVPVPKSRLMLENGTYDQILPLQLVATCGPYTLYTHEIAFVVLDNWEHKDCVEVLGLNIGCDPNLYKLREYT